MTEQSGRPSGGHRLVADVFAVLGAIAVVVTIIGGLVLLRIVKVGEGGDPSSAPPTQPSSAVITSSPTTPPSGPATEPPSECVEPLFVIWKPDNVGVNGYPKTNLTVDLPGCSTLMVTSGHLVGPDGQECGYQADQVCVVLYRATTRATVRVTGLDVGHAWYGTTTATIAQALADKHSQLLSLNCSGGCRFATLFAYVDGVPQPSRTMTP